MKRNYLLLILICLNISLSFAQDGFKIIGKTIDKKSNQPIEFATIIIVDNVTKKPITGTTTQIDGSFNVTTNSANFYVEVTFIGYLKKTINDFSTKNKVINLGSIILEEDTESLDEVVVRAEKSQTSFKLDKRIFNVGTDLSSTGASALEVLNNVPSVNVNIEGQISLRGSQGVQILINGKPSILADEGSGALGTLTAEMIDRIEVITNPSAKYDAEGTSGIINIVLRKEEKRGINGSVSVNVGTPNNNSIGVSLNKRTEKFNLFTQLGLGRRTFPFERINNNEDFENNTSLRTEGDGNKHENFYNLILGTDYHINDNNVITLSGNFAYEVEDEDSENLFSYFEENAQTQGWTRTEVTEATNPKYQFDFQYHSDFKSHEDHDLTFSALGSFFGKDKTSDFADRTTFGDRDDFDQQTATDFKEARYTFKLDYTYPFADKYTIELGSQYIINDVTNDYEVGTFDNGNLILDPNLTNNFNFDQNVLGIYVTFGVEFDKLGLKAGLRLENTDINTLLENTNEKNAQNYTDLFPSAHASYKLTDDISMQVGYSRRIYRPRMWDLNPFFNIRNNFNISTGNPNLEAEYTDSYEVTSIFKLGKASFNFGVFHRYTTDVIEDVTTFSDGISTRLPINSGTNNTTGIEFNFKYSPIKWASFLGDFNWNNFDRKGTFEDTVLDFDGNRWTSRATAKLKLPAGFDFEIEGNYRSKYKTLQGEQEHNTFANLGLRKKLFKGKLVANLSVRDIFESRISESRTNQPTFSTYNRNQRGRFVTFGLSYGFGKGEAMEFHSTKRR
jgi:outer membrane receptor protein involved in Fe transport